MSFRSGRNPAVYAGGGGFDVVMVNLARSAQVGVSSAFTRILAPDTDLSLISRFSSSANVLSFPLNSQPLPVDNSNVELDNLSRFSASYVGKK